ncbi:class I SAM-dependent methyltransferase [Desulfonatronovibrio magnus]|uniref:class I SAM-dependent methyltransferase n=1 Tax=Desulfonatronovibrio magnus TaxID=698827 RepID=UPI0006984679|nr:class I SAM-dependent methyltransferase [Desulfonatronovibrio magnus]
MVNNLYNLIFSDMSKLCYTNCLQLYPEKAQILDVGIGNGVMIKKNHKLIKEKNLQIIGLDINKHYLEHCRKLISEYSLENQVQVIQESVLKFTPPNNINFDYVFFGQSFMLMSEQKEILEKTKQWLKPEGKVVFFQTMFKNKSKLMEFVKPRLKFLTTVDFGKVTYEKEFYKLLSEGNFSSCEDKLLKKNVFKGEHRLIITQPQNVMQH